MRHNRLLRDDKALLIFLFILNLVGNGVWLSQQCSALSVFLVVALSAIIAVVEAAVCHWLKSPARQLFAGVIIAIHNVVGIVDYFLLIQFGTVINMSTLDTLLVTNSGEAAEFTSTYITPSVVVLLLAGTLLVNGAVYGLAWIAGKHCKAVAVVPATAALGGMFLIADVVLLFFHTSIHVATPMHHALSRVAWEYGRIMHETHIGNLLHVCRQVQAVRSQDSPLKVIVIIGESHSVYHTSLYGYDKQTYPLMEGRERAGELFVFKNAVTSNDVTALVMGSVFSLDSMGISFNDYPLFPAVFKAAGFTTSLYDNEYLADESLNFMSNRTLSDQLYDRRNSRYYDYDGEMIDDMGFAADSLSLYILHLTGHHVRYNKRYPASFARFKAGDYGGRHTQEQKEVIAAYDNACIYNDYIVDKVIRQFEDEEAVCVYFSDHGEEVYDLRDFRGHGSSRYSPDISYQLRVPLWVWLSDKYREHHPQVAERLQRALELHVKTDDIAYFLMDLADIETKWMKPDRSCITEGSYHGWKDYREMIVSYDGFNTNEGETLRQFSHED